MENNFYHLYGHDLCRFSLSIAVQKRVINMVYYGIAFHGNSILATLFFDSISCNYHGTYRLQKTELRCFSFCLVCPDSSILDRAQKYDICPSFPYNFFSV